jgi:hypothetical protein
VPVFAKESTHLFWAELDLFVGNTPQHDDVTCMLLKTESL